MSGPLSLSLTNPRSDRVRAVRSLSGRSARARHGRFLVEGPQAVREAVLAAAEHVLEIFLTERAAARYPEIVDAARERRLVLRGAGEDVVSAMSADAQGVLAVLRQHTSGLADLPAAPSLVALLATVRDPGNAGTVIRAADAAGADGAVLAGESVDVHNPKVIRSTAGSLFHLPVVSGVSVSDATSALRGAGCTILAADGGGDHDLDDLLDVAGGAPHGVPDLAAPTVWLFGNEAQGLSDSELALADASVRVPLRGRAESLNLATAATVCLYASSRAHRAR
ncbi:RNA methyltransferase, TrmH family [Paraoerskovia marina]|uniref:RNA methyltransferase, TrmH family n=1 Tax=Paraoerskovia marina TaxID=545619 RepID=A0A1H1TL62_9CELL|nr:RNA methyltransferase [Paraoerskovia marina]SDS60993.1 RNA methyltransferase, TrmH family [Paraoerskovia marina]